MIKENKIIIVSSHILSDLEENMENVIALKAGNVILNEPYSSKVKKIFD